MGESFLIGERNLSPEQQRQESGLYLFQRVNCDDIRVKVPVFCVVFKFVFVNARNHGKLFSELCLPRRIIQTVGAPSFERRPEFSRCLLFRTGIAIERCTAFFNESPNNGILSAVFVVSRLTACRNAESVVVRNCFLKCSQRLDTETITSLIHPVLGYHNPAFINVFTFVAALAV